MRQPGLSLFHQSRARHFHLHGAINQFVWIKHSPSDSQGHCFTKKPPSRFHSLNEASNHQQFGLALTFNSIMLQIYTPGKNSWITSDLKDRRHYPSAPNIRQSIHWEIPCYILSQTCPTCPRMLSNILKLPVRVLLHSYRPPSIFSVLRATFWRRQSSCAL